MKTKRVIIDCDPAIGVKYRDLDDGLAILFLLASPEVELEGITINFGNAKAPVGLEKAREVLKVVGKDIPVFIGAQSRKELGSSNPAVDYLIDSVNRFPGEISLLAVAPLTNVATAMMIDSSFAKNLKKLVIMGGTFSFPFFSFIGEFNFHCDGQAASRVIRDPFPKTVLTMDVCSQAVFQEQHLRRILEKDSPAAGYLAEKITPWLRLNKKVFFRRKGFFPWDPVAAAYLIDRALFSEEVLYEFSIAESGFRAGRILDPKIQKRESGDAPGRLMVPMKLDGERFMEFFMSRLLSL